MAFFKYTWDNTTRVFLPGDPEKKTVKPNWVIEVDEKHAEYNESMYLGNNFILTKMEDKKEEKEDGEVKRKPGRPKKTNK